MLAVFIIGVLFLLAAPFGLFFALLYLPLALILALTKPYR